MATDKLLILITGANTGLGYYAVQQLSVTNKFHILLGSRNLSKAKDAITALEMDASGSVNVANIEPVQIDVTSDMSIDAAAKYVEDQYGYLDILVNNAGISQPTASNSNEFGSSIREEYRQVYDTNLFGAVVVVEAFLPLLRKSTKPGGKRIAFTGSSTASLELTTNATQGGMKARFWSVYRSTKTALNMVMASYTDKLEEEGFIVSACCPGHCATNLNNHTGLKDPREGAKMIVKGVNGPKQEIHGILFNENGKVPW